MRQAPLQCKGMRTLSVSLLLVAGAAAAYAQEFEVVSIKPNKSAANSSGVHTNQGRMSANNVSLRSLIVMAYDIRDYQLEGPDCDSQHSDSHNTPYTGSCVTMITLAAFLSHHEDAPAMATAGT